MNHFVRPDGRSARFKGDPATLAMKRAYKLWAPVYDIVCGRLFLSSRRIAATLARNAGRTVLEIGVGTGLSLGDYAANNHVTGIDLSPEMIAKARERASRECPAACDLMIMDAHRLTFPDAAFDAVVAQFVVTLVEDAERVLDECLRVVAPGGEIILVNHFYSETGFAAWLERQVAPVAHLVGLRPDFPFSRIENWVQANSGVEVIERRASGPFGWFNVVRLRKSAV